MHPYYVMRLSGGGLYFIGSLMMVVNVWRTIRGDVRDEQPLHAPKHDVAADRPVVQPARA
jgi:cytochrome c oxidase cbb3-type subunit 1